MARLRTTLTSPRHRLVGMLCATALACGPSIALAAPASSDAAAPSNKAQAEALSEQAVGAFGDKRYDESIEQFEQAYALDPNPNYLFNIGRVYEEKGDLQQAVDHYQQFVSQPGVDLDAREAATARLKVLRDALDQLKEPEPEDDPEPEPEPLATSVAEDPADSGPGNRRRGQRIAGYTLLGMGGAGLIVGGVLGGLASTKANEADDEPFVDDALRMRDDARRQARAADAMFITGGVLAATGLVLVLTTLGKKKAKASSSLPSRGGARRWVVAPVAAPRSAGAVLHARF